MAAMAQADAKRRFLTVCRNAIEQAERAYVKDKAERPYLTLDPKRRHLTGPVVEIRAQFFKDNFARCSSLVKDGLCFRLTLRGGGRIYARRHANYRDACDGLITEWQAQVAAYSIAQRHETDLLRLYSRVERSGESKQEELVAAIADLKRGIARLAIGHRPFEEGQLPNDA